MSETGKREILAAIRWYSKRGYDWGDVVCFLALKHTGRLDGFMRPWRGGWKT